MKIFKLPWLGCDCILLTVTDILLYILKCSYCYSPQDLISYFSFSLHIIHIMTFLKIETLYICSLHSPPSSTLVTISVGNLTFHISAICHCKAAYVRSSLSSVTANFDNNSSMFMHIRIVMGVI